MWKDKKNNIIILSVLLGCITVLVSVFLVLKYSKDRDKLELENYSKEQQVEAESLKEESEEKELNELLDIACKMEAEYDMDKYWDEVCHSNNLEDNCTLPVEAIETVKSFEDDFYEDCLVGLRKDSRYQDISFLQHYIDNFDDYHE